MIRAIAQSHVSDPYPFAIDEVFDVYRLLVESGM